MTDLSAFLPYTVFLTAAFFLAVTPGPGLFYVFTRSIKGGRREGLTSTLGTSVGGLFHVLAAALGVSTLLATSAYAFSAIKYLGAAYLIYLGIKTLLNKDDVFSSVDMTNAENVSEGVAQKPSGNAFKQGVITEVLNPKTALFFIAFIPQFIQPEYSVMGQFVALGCVVVGFNTTADIVVACLAGPIGGYLQTHSRTQRAQKVFCGSAFIALGAVLGSD
ncbi:MAG: LysE family translocator [Desulfovibrio sp.]